MIRSRSCRALVGALVVLLGGVTASVAAPAAAAVPMPSAPMRYLPPVGPPQAIIVGHFRPPPTPYASGDRGVDYATIAGTPVQASAAGRVLFAGPVAGTLAVTLVHADGLRTSYSFLASVTVAVGDDVAQGQVIATTGTFFHFGVRDPAGTYLDPEALFAGRLGAHLVPGADDGQAALGTSRFSFAGEVQAMLGVVADHLGASAAPSVALAHLLLALTPPVSLAALARELEDWRRSQEGCTPAGVVPPPSPGRRIAVLVAGVGSNDTKTAIDDLDTATLGYAAGDVVRFSYKGGRAAGRKAPPGGVARSIPASAYGPADTETDLRPVADRLLALLGRLAALAPGVPIDVIAHSQGGVVVHLALIQAHARGDLPAQLGTVVTISSPHQGTDLATGLAALKGTAVGELALQVLRPASGGTLDPDSTSLTQLSETSDLAQELRQPLPAGVHLLSIGASGDPVVPWVRTRTPGATSDLIPMVGFGTHSALPGSPAVTREIALARAGLGPTCVDLAQGIAMVVTSHLVAQSEDALGADLTLAADQ